VTVSVRPINTTKLSELRRLQSATGRTETAVITHLTASFVRSFTRTTGRISPPYFIHTAPCRHVDQAD